MKSLKLNYGSSAKGSEANTDRLSSFSIFLLFAAVLYQAFFCFMNTNIAPINAGYLMLTEVILMGIVTINFLSRQISLPVLSLLIFIFANAFVLVLFQQYFDPKNIRNLMTPILLIWLGTQYNNKISTDKLVKYLASVVVLVGVFEFVLPEIYQLIFNVINYHIAIGRSTEAALKYLDGSFSLNGTRWGGRNLLPFLGDHRASSIFLETVSMGNFAVLIGCWGLSKSNVKESLFFIIAALTVAVLADSRFASTLLILLMLMRVFLSIKMLERVSYFVPLLILMICFYLDKGDVFYSDDFAGRLGSTGNYILNFQASEFFGVYSRHYSMFVDQGYAYLIHFCGMAAAIILWVCFCRLPVDTNQAKIFKSLVGILIAANLAISGDSLFAFKWSALMWFLLGTLITKKFNNGFKIES